MKPGSIRLKRLVAGFAGLIYAVLYGFFTMLVTGGGHGNFVWFLSFIFIEFFGMYFPLMAVLAVDLGSRFTKIIFGSLIGFNVLGSLLMVWGWVSNRSPDDFEKTWRMDPFVVLTCAVVHLFPAAFFSFLLIRAILFGGNGLDDEEIVSLGLT